MIKIIDRKLIYLISLLIFIINIENCFTVIYSNGHQVNFKKNFELKDIGKKSSNIKFASSNDLNVFWFLQISDTQFLWYDNKKIAYFYEFLNETYNTIAPLFIYHTGDIVGANYGFKQDEEEWSRYKEALDNNNFNASTYLDVIGNHDAIHDPNFTNFLNYSMMGQSFNTTQYSFNHSFSFGEYVFIGLNTAKKSYDLFEFGFQGFLTSAELNWYESELEKYKDYDKIFVFGHHPPNYPPIYEIESEVSDNGKNFNDLNDEFNVSFYISGHTHSNSFRYVNNIITITTTNFDALNGTFRIISLDNNRLSSSIGYVGDWPQAIITNPSEEDYLFENLTINESKLRVLAWDPKGITSVKWSLFDYKSENQLTNWKSIERSSNDSPLWEGVLDLVNYENFLLKVEIDGGSGKAFRELNFYLKNDSSDSSDPTLIFLIIFIITIIGVVALSLIINHYTHIRKDKKN